MTTLIDISEDIQYSLNLDEVFQNVILSCMGQLDPYSVDIFTIKKEFIQKVTSSKDQDKNNTKEINIKDKMKFKNNETNLVEILKDKEYPIKVEELYYNGNNEKIKTLFNNKYNYIIPLIYDSNLEGFIYIDFSNKEDGFNLSSEEKSFLKNLANITSITLKNISQYTYLENILTYYNNISQNLINIFKHSSEPSSKIIKKTIDFIIENFYIDSIAIFFKSKDFYTPFYVYGYLAEFKENFDENINDFLKYINQYENDWIIESQIEKDNPIYKIFNEYNIKIPEGLLVKRIVNRNIDLGLIMVTSRNIKDDYFLTSPDFEYIFEIITLLLSYHLSSFTL